MAMLWLRQQFPEAILIPELAIAKYGDALLDVAALMPTDIYGVEVKGEGDSPSRLLRQGWVYSRAASHMWVLPSPCLRQRVARARPPGWGILEVMGDGRVYPTLNTYRQRLPNAPAALLGILWKRELIALGRELEASFNSKSAVHDIADSIAESIPLGDIRSGVCRTLYKRPWRSPLPVGLGKPVFYPDEPITESWGNV